MTDQIVMVQEAGMAGKLFLGFDVSKEFIDVARHDGLEVTRIANAEAAIAAFLLAVPPVAWRPSSRPAAMSGRCDGH